MEHVPSSSEIRKLKIRFYDIIVFLFILALYVFENATYSTLFQVIQGAFVAVTAYYMISKRKVRVTKVYIWCLVFLVFVFLVSLFNDFLSRSDVLSIVIKNVIRGVCISFYITENNNNWKKLVYSIGISGVVCSFFLLSEFLSAGLVYTNLKYAAVDRIGADIAGRNVNIVAMNMCFAFASLIYVIYASTNKKIKVISVIAAILVVGTTMLTGTRKVLLYFIVVYAAYYLFWGRRDKKKKIILPLIILAVAYYCMMNIQPLYYLIGHKIDFFKGNDYYKIYEVSDTRRTELAKGGIELFIQNPVFGSGFGTTARTLGTYSHDNYIEILASGGVIGFVIYYSIYFFTLSRSWVSRRRNRTAFFVLVSIIGLMCLDIFQVTYLYGMPVVILAFYTTYIQFWGREES